MLLPNVHMVHKYNAQTNLHCQEKGYIPGKGLFPKVQITLVFWGGRVTMQGQLMCDTP